MKPVYQTTFGKGIGNCFTACVASIIEYPIEDVPNWMTDDYKFTSQYYDEKFSTEFLTLVRFKECAIWLNNRGYDLYHYLAEPFIIPDNNHIYIAIFSLKNFDGNHAVLYQKSQIIFNPNPCNLELGECHHLFLILKKEESYLLDQDNDYGKI
jgi:hypothetical protein